MEPQRVQTPVTRRESDQEHEPAPPLHPLFAWDLSIVRSIVDFRERSPALESLIIATTSRYRTQDISLALWLVFLAMLPDFGLPYMWISVSNLLAVLLLQYLAEVLRPIDVDPSLPTLPTCTDPDTYAFPCVDAHMSVVILLPVLENTDSLVAQSVFALIGIYIAATRVALGSRFITQVVGSWLTGLTGMVVGNHGHVMVKTYRLSAGYNTAAIVALIAFLMLVVGNWIENNESRLIGVPKADFMDVLTNILGSDGAPTASESVGVGARVHQLPLHPGRQPVPLDRDDEDDNSSQDHVLLGKKDSFYYLLRGLSGRARINQPPVETTRRF